MFVYGGKQAEESGAAGGSLEGRRKAVRSAADEISAEGRRFEVALLVAGLPAAGREACAAGLLPLAGKRPAWQEEDVGEEAEAQCRDWWHPLAEERLRQQTPRGLVLTIQTELEGGLRTMRTPLWLLNRIVRRVWLLHQGQRVGQAYRELERQLGDGAQALAWVSRMVAGLSRVGILDGDG
jgi:hypothetical protein